MKNRLLKLLISFLLLVAFALVVVNVSMVVLLSDITRGSQKQDENLMSMISGKKAFPAIIPAESEIYSSTDKEFKLYRMDDDLNDDMKDFFTKKLIEEYLVMRYTITGDKFFMQRNMGDFHKNYATSRDELSPIYFWSMKMLPISLKKYASQIDMTANDEPTDAWFSYLNLEVPVIKDKMQKAITRSVEILQPPYKDKDLWKVKIRLTYKDSTTFSREVYEDYLISMEIIFAPKNRVIDYYYYTPFNPDVSIADRYGGAYAFFDFHVLYLSKTKTLD